MGTGCDGLEWIYQEGEDPVRRSQYIQTYPYISNPKKLGKADQHLKENQNRNEDGWNHQPEDVSHKGQMTKISWTAKDL